MNLTPLEFSKLLDIPLERILYIESGNRTLYLDDNWWNYAKKLPITQKIIKNIRKCSA